MELTTKLKIYDYLFAVCFFLSVIMAIMRWGEGINFYPAWLIFTLFGICIFSFIKRQEIWNRIYPPTLPIEQTPPPIEKEPTEKISREKYSQLKKEAHDLIETMCRRKNIRLTRKQEGVSRGHYDLPEIWIFEKPFPLDPEEFYAITINPVLNAETEITDEKVIYVQKFTMDGGWITYNTEDMNRE